MCSATCGGGTKTRSREVLVREECGGEECSGSDKDTHECSTHCCPVHCEWDNWGKWQQCSASCGGGVQHRSRVPKRNAECGGIECAGKPLQSQTCNPQCCPSDCKWGPWGDFSDCSAKCEGTQTRTRSVEEKESCGGTCPGSDSETISCNGCCPVNCVWDNWSDYGSCSVTCGKGTQSRSRSVAVSASCGGKECSGSNQQTKACREQCCPVDCVWDEWGEFGSCSAKCGAGTQNRYRKIATKSACGGAECTGSKVDTRSCDAGCCPVDCRWGDWAEYGDCSATCGLGSQVRYRNITEKASCGGKECSGSNQQTKACREQCCPVDCVWDEWGEFGSCSAKCGAGTQNRYRKIATKSACGGAECTGSKVDTRSCDAGCCPVDCRWGDWVAYGDCSATCGLGSQVRYRNITEKASCGGKECSGSNQQTKACREQCCPVDCVWDEWGEFGSCSAKCGAGTQNRYRKIATKSACGGAECTGSKVDTRSCDAGCCPVDCRWGDWAEYGDCSATCGLGSQVRYRNVTQVASCGGKECSGSDSQTKMCDAKCCPVDCRWGDWGQFGACSASCGGGKQSRKRKIAVPAKCGGTPCTGETLDWRECNNECCPVNCRWGSWSKFDSCSVTCGGGNQTRSREIEVPESCGGSGCEGETTESRTCGERCCPVDCVWGEWSDFHQCTATCGTGK